MGTGFRMLIFDLKPKIFLYFYLSLFLNFHYAFRKISAIISATYTDN
jgi:hypothetical protein